ncbi:Fatty acid hydroxylase family (carotene hydroxylase/sterol desaturase) [hydrothermal vent metagenome]|uniref:Fatty acid hydroxylase family (Carotene hydroxylase/sterol desaturase) n=1 Tax=hydrothermal vent metagenome TaxID=652676 RepID=A0A3B1ACV2_9ZZZZ
MTFNEFVVQNEITLRIGFFFGIFAVMATWEVIAPRRALTVSKAVRWVNNLGLVFLNNLLLRLLFPAAAIGMAAFAAEHGWGLLNYYSLPFALSVVLAVVALDFIIYLQHVLTHAVPTLWRLHRVHHADLDYDVTTGARFHPIEIILSLLIKFATIIVLGAPVVAVVIFEVVLNAMAMFNHSNVSLPRSLDRIMRLFVVTPDMHRVHHSTEDNEANSNFGFNLSLWDRLFGTYIDQPREGHDHMIIGIHRYRDPKQVNQLPGMLTLPFVGKISGYAINRREWSKPTENEE